MRTYALSLRYLKICVILLPTLFVTFVFLGNLMDYDSNYQFVKHVLSMDTTFEGNQLMWRAITSEAAHTIANIALITAEGLVALLGWVTVVRMLGVARRTLGTFQRAKSLGIYMFLLAFCIWYLGFIVIGSEWFAMWQSEVWNGKQTAMDIVEVFLGFMIVFLLPDGNIEDR
ncbi:DUF2165 family protein [Paenibacillus sp. GCM10023252]|uniref:DUF2165 family protein n=1 Tax=Paenibacillus sp. GCM10023252 TaxID=3252649 RepID=UPI003619F36E